MRGYLLVQTLSFSFFFFLLIEALNQMYSWCRTVVRGCLMASPFHHQGMYVLFGYGVYFLIHITNYGLNSSITKIFDGLECFNLF